MLAAGEVINKATSEKKKKTAVCSITGLNPIKYDIIVYCLGIRQDEMQIHFVDLVKEVFISGRLWKAAVGLFFLFFFSLTFFI